MITFENFYQQFLDAESKQQKAELASLLQSQGYSFINEWMIQLERELRWVDKERDRVDALLRKAEEILHEPQQFSPLWRGIWQELHLILNNKQAVLEKVSEEERDGEWQVILDNPSSNEGLTTHARLSFPEAAFLFAKFRKGLGTKEFISLQRVKTFITEKGEMEPRL